MSSQQDQAKLNYLKVEKKTKYFIQTGKQKHDLNHLFLKGFLKGNHCAGLLSLIADSIKVPASKIVDLDLSFVDVQQGQLLGMHEEFISSARIDNLFSSWAALRALTNDTVDGKTENLTDTNYVNIICLYDHEECGS